MAEKRQLSETEKQKVLDQHEGRCFVDGEPIPEDEPIEFHHIKPFSSGSPTSMDNIAPVCKRHHRTIGTMSLQEYRDKIELAAFFEGGEAEVLLSQGATVGEAARKIEVTEQTYYRWRKDNGGMRIDEVKRL